MTTLTQRSQLMELVAQAIATGARQDRACAAICLSERTLLRWQRSQSRGDQRPMRVQAPRNRLSVLERQSLLAVANSDEFGHLALNRKAKHTSQVDAFQPGGINFADQFGWNDLAPIGPTIQNGLHPRCIPAHHDIDAARGLVPSAHLTLASNDLAKSLQRVV